MLRLQGHADEGMVLDGRVREVDRLGNNAADEAADFGRRRVGNAVIDARRNLSGVCGRWHPVIIVLHRFGLLVHIPRGVVWFMRFVTGPVAWATLCLGFGMGSCSCICHLC